MKSIIIVGNKKAKVEYIDNYIKDNNIRSYNIYRFEERLKIADVKEIKKNLSIRMGSIENRLIILPNDITIEAQNALLKTLEELPQNTAFIISTNSKDNLLPTIISRSFIIQVGSSNIEVIQNDEIENVIIELSRTTDIERKIYLSLLFAEHVLQQNKENVDTPTNEIEKLMLYLRQTLIKEIKNSSNNTQLILKEINQIINLLTKYYPYIIKNNLNKRLTLEKVLLENILCSKV